MVRDQSEDKELGERAAEKLERRNIIHELIGVRIARGLSQGDMAKKMGCSQSKVSKFENSKDDDLRIGDFHRYTDALGLEMTICLTRKGRTMADTMRSHVAAVQSLIKRLTKWAKHDDAVIAKGAELAFMKVAAQLSETLLGAIKEIRRVLPNSPAVDRPSIAIEPEYQDQDANDPASEPSDNTTLSSAC
jgi:transcriptional regulator with XRE-family HTH domain